MEHQNRIMLREKAIVTGKLLILVSELSEESESCYLPCKILKKLRWKINVAVIIRVLNTFIFVRFEVFMAVTMKNGVFWDVTPCGSCKNRRFGGT
jgi:hypothetical protein